MAVDSSGQWVAQQLVDLESQFASPAVPVPVEFGLLATPYTVDVELDSATASAQVLAAIGTARADPDMTAAGALPGRAFGRQVAVLADPLVLPAGRRRVCLRTAVAR
ncbi:hypothetical protein [Mycobacteroides abscessus]|uniref:hypothetical protein n=1 Tax=Mycobacteroides abscessus TaxID=36809 RepID=UPI001F391C31|nr:hypothetical protein [Mycobacteroides abscessus]